MNLNRIVTLSRYRFDPLDRLIISSPLIDTEKQHFYCKNRLTTEIQGSKQHSIIQHGEWLLAQHQRHENTLETKLFGTDQLRSVLHTVSARQTKPITYTPYGYRRTESGLLSLLGFTGERSDPVTGHYLLGNGYRALNPILMRFNSPDSSSPFGKGGLNPYAYVLGDPINRRDPTGHNPLSMQPIIDALMKYKPRLKIPRPTIISSKPTNTSLGSSPSDGYTLAGFHGSSSKHIKSFEEGLDIKHAGSANGQKHGEGFYATRDIDFAGNYAKTSIDREYKRINKTLFPYADFSYDPAIANTSYVLTDNSPTIFGVYVKDYPAKIPGKDFKYIPGERNTAAGSEIIFPPSMYDSIRLTPVASLASPPTPWTANLNIRKR